MIGYPSSTLDIEKYHILIAGIGRSYSYITVIIKFKKENITREIYLSERDCNKIMKSTINFKRRKCIYNISELNLTNNEYKMFKEKLGDTIEDNKKVEHGVMF